MQEPLKMKIYDCPVEGVCHWHLSVALLLPFCRPANHNIPIKLFTEFLSKSLSESIVSVFQNGEHASFRYSLQNISKAHLN